MSANWSEVEFMIRHDLIEWCRYEMRKAGEKNSVIRVNAAVIEAMMDECPSGPVVEIARYSGLSVRTTSDVLKRLQVAGMLTTVASPARGRKLIYTLKPTSEWPDYWSAASRK